MMAAILNSAIMDSAILHKKNFTHSFWLNLMMAAILNSAMLWFRHCHLGFRHLYIFSQIHSKTLSLHSDSDRIKLIHSHLTWWNLGFSHFAQTSDSIQSDSNSTHSTWWWQPSWILPSWIQPFCTISLTQTTHSHCQDWIPPFTQKRTSLIHSYSTWWWQPSWILPCWIQTLPSWIQHTLLSSLRLTHSKTLNSLHSDSTWWWLLKLSAIWIQTLHSWTSMMATHLEFFHDCIQPSWIQPFCSKWLWLKLIQSDSNSFILIQLDDSHLEFCHLGAILNSDSTWWWLLEICHLGFRHCHLGFRHLVIFSQIHSKNTLPPLWLWLKLIQYDTNFHSYLTWWWYPSWLPSLIQPKKKLHLFILTQLDDGSHLEFCHLGFIHCHLGFTQLVIFSQIQSKTLSLHSDYDSN